MEIARPATYREKIMLPKKTIYQWSKQGELVKTYYGLSSAADGVGSGASNIKYCCEGKSKHVKGYLWSYDGLCPSDAKEYYAAKDKLAEEKLQKQRIKHVKAVAREEAKLEPKVNSREKKKVYQWTAKGELIGTHDSMTEAANDINTTTSNIKYCCEGQTQHVKGFLWSYTGTCPEVPEELRRKDRMVHTNKGTYNSVKETVAAHGFKSTAQVRHRCLSEKFEDWYYVN
jgi:pyruvoyl-dependent arginine decarboxylase (PvlArgDC)